MQRVWELVRREAKGFVQAGLKFYRNHGFDRSAALAFWALIAFLPFLLMLVGAFGLIVDWIGEPQDRARLMGEIVAALRSAFPRLGPDVSTYLEALVAERGTLSLTAVPLFLLTTSALYGTLESALAYIFHQGRSRSIARSKLVGLVFATILLAGLVVGAGAAVALGNLTGSDGSVVGAILHSGLGAVAVEIVVFAGVFVILVRWFVLDVIPYRLLLAGGILFGSLWMVARALFSLYLDTIAPYGIIYGSLATIVVILIWAYYSAIIFLYSAERIALWREAAKQREESRHGDG